MVIETVEERLARVERGCERIADRLGVIEHRLTSIEPRLASGVASLAYELMSALESLRAEVRTGDGRIRKQGVVHFYWMLTFIVSSILIALLLELIP